MHASYQKGVWAISKERLSVLSWNLSIECLFKYRKCSKEGSGGGWVGWGRGILISDNIPDKYYDYESKE